MTDATEPDAMPSLSPTADPRAFRKALGRFATGVTVITADTGDGPIGITANSFASVSLDPPLVLWSPARSSKRYRYFRDAVHFAIHVLGADQQALCRRFARAGDDWDGADWAWNAERVPVLGGCLARFECRRTARHDGGDHDIIVAEVLRANWRDGEPLIFSQGAYGRFTGARRPRD